MFAQAVHAGLQLGLALTLSTAVFTLQQKSLKVVLAVGESVKVPDSNVAVTFKDVVGDSRCPAGTTCIWEGDAAVLVSFDTQGKSQTYTLHTSQQFQREAEHDGIRVVLISLAPHPAAGSSLRRDQYRANLLIERK